MRPQRVSFLAELVITRVSVLVGNFGLKYGLVSAHSCLEFGFLEEAPFSSLKIRPSTKALHNSFKMWSAELGSLIMRLV